jgi:purine-cytosine permease-like protein
VTATPSPRHPRITEIEQHGINTIPDADRTSGPRDLFRIQFGGANTFATVLIGTTPIMLGLSLGQAVLATVLGVLVGAVILAPMGLFGPRTGTNNAVSSGAHLGVRGRIVGSFLSLLTAIAFYSISVWVSGDALVGGAARLFGVPDSTWLRAAVYAVLGAVVIVVVVYGYQFMLLVNKVVVVANTVLMLLAVLAFASAFASAFAGAFGTGGAAPAEYALGSFWPTFVLSALIVMGNPVSFGAFLGDWSRYIPADTPPARLLGATLLAQLATLVPFLFGVLTATLTVGRGDYVFTLIQLSPAWYAPLLMIVAFLGGLSTGITSLYGTGLDFSSVFPRLSRVAASLLVGAVAFVFILAGRLLFDLTASVNAFIGAIVICTTPWMAIMMIGYLVRRGHYYPVDVQVFNQGRIGGRYWFTGGVNWRPMTAWLVAAAVGLLFANYPPLVVGPLHDVAGGIDISLPVSLALAAAIYLASLWIAPEPGYAYGPSGPRWVPVRDAVPPPVTDDTGASAHRVARRVPNT